MPYHLLADLVLALHFAVAAFVLTYPLLVAAGALRRHPRLNGRGLRLIHGALIALVIVQSWLGVVCPLTTLEGWLRIKASESAYAGGFIEFWLRRLLFYEAPPWVFIAAYTAFGLLVATIWWRFPPATGDRRTA